MRLLSTLVGFVLISTAAAAEDVPRFQAEPFWPKPLPDNWVLGQVSGIAVDRNDHVWIVHRPGPPGGGEKGARQDPPPPKCCKGGPPRLEVDQGGKLLPAAGGPRRGRD